MGRRARTPFAVLGVLAKSNKSGYGINALFETARYVFWNEAYGQIYPALKKLVGSEFAEHISSVKGQGVGKKIYGLTDEGLDELKRWLRTQADPVTMRDELVLRVSFGNHVNPAVTRGLLESELERVDGMLDELEQSNLDELNEFERMAWNWSWMYLDERGVWIEECLAKLDELEAAD